MRISETTSKYYDEQKNAIPAALVVIVLSRIIYVGHQK